MNIKRIIFMNNNGLSVYTCTGNNIAATGEFSLSDMEDFESLIHAQNYDTYIITDLIDEEFRRELIPAVNLWDRRKIAKRKLKHYFPKSDHKTYLFQWREKSQRRDYHALFLSLYNTKILNLCLQCLEANQTPLVGIFSLPLLSRHLLGTLRIEHTQVLLVTLQKNSGIRHTYFQNTNLLFSRLSSLSDNPERPIEEIIILEIEKTKNYLQRMKLLKEKRPFHIVIVTDDTLINKIKNIKPSELQLEYKDNQEIASKTKLSHDSHDRYSNNIFVGLLRKLIETNHYANHNERKYYYIKRGKTLMQWVSIAACLAILLTGSFKLYSIKQLENNFSKQKTIIQQLREEKKSILAVLPSTPEQLSMILEESKLQKRVNASQLAPFQAIDQIRNILANEQNLTINKLFWTTQSNDIRTEFTEIPYLPPEPNRFFITLQGSIKIDRLDYVSAFTQLYHIVDSLKNSPNINRVIIQRYPLDADPDKAITGIFTSRSKNTRGEFQIQIRYQTSEKQNAVASF